MFYNIIKIREGQYLEYLEILTQARIQTTGAQPTCAPPPNFCSLFTTL